MLEESVYWAFPPGSSPPVPPWAKGWTHSGLGPGTRTCRRSRSRAWSRCWWGNTWRSPPSSWWRRRWRWRRWGWRSPPRWSASCTWWCSWRPWPPGWSTAGRSASRSTDAAPCNLSRCSCGTERETTGASRMHRGSRCVKWRYRRGQKISEVWSPTIKMRIKSFITQQIHSSFTGPQIKYQNLVRLLSGWSSQHCEINPFFCSSHTIRGFKLQPEGSIDSESCDTSSILNQISSISSGVQWRGVNHSRAGKSDVLFSVILWLTL